jgi:hypothetical protein
VLDLFYMLPPGQQSEGDLPYFEVTWKVHAGDRVVAMRTPFQRAEAPADEYAYGPAPPAYFSVGLGWSPYWWYGPFWPYPRTVVAFPRAHYPYRVVGPTAGFRAYGGAWRGTPVAPPTGGWHGQPVR